MVNRELYPNWNKAFQFSGPKNSSKWAVFSGGKCYVKKSLLPLELYDSSSPAEYSEVCVTYTSAQALLSPPKKEGAMLNRLKIQLLIVYPQITEIYWCRLTVLTRLPFFKKVAHAYIILIPQGQRQMISKYWCLRFLAYLSKSQITNVCGSSNIPSHLPMVNMVLKSLHRKAGEWPFITPSPFSMVKFNSQPCKLRISF